VGRDDVVLETPEHPANNTSAALASAEARTVEMFMDQPLLSEASYRVGMVFMRAGTHLLK
jgi:hypothetical protein